MNLRSIAFLRPILVCVAASLPACSQTTPPFAITAADVTLASDTSGGTGAYVVSGIPMTGFLVVNCAYAGPATTAKLPECGHGLVVQIPVTAGQSVMGGVPINPYATPVPASESSRAGASASLALLLGGIGLLGLGLPGRGRRRLSTLLLSMGAAAALLALGACGGSSNPFAMTPGTYAYTLTALNSNNAVTPLGQSVSTTFTVTVP